MKDQEKTRSAYKELAVLLLLIIASGLLLRRDDIFWTSFSPSPYWLPVLLIPLRYGSPAGMVSGVVCAIIYFVSYNSFSTDNFFESIFLKPETLILPASFIAISHYIGENVHSMAMRTDFFRGELKEAQESIDRLESEKQHLEQSYREIEGQIAGESSSLYRLLASLQVFSTCESEDIPSTACALAKRFVAGKHSSFWHLSKGKWERMYPGISGEAPQILDIALEEGRPVNVRDFPTAVDTDDIDFAIAMPSTIEGEADALCIGGVQFSEWNTRLGDKLSTILWWALTAEKRCTLQRTLAESLPYERELSLSGEVFLRTHVQKALLAQERSGGISSIFFLKVRGDRARDLRILAIVASALRCLMRDSDAKAYLRKSGYFAIFMPGTPKTGGEIACDKVTTGLHNLQICPKGECLIFDSKFYELKKRQDIDRILSEINGEQQA